MRVVEASMTCSFPGRVLGPTLWRGGASRVVGKPDSRLVGSDDGGSYLGMRHAATSRRTFTL